MAMTQESACLQEKIKHDSFKERETHWNGVHFNEAMIQWKTEINNFLNPYKADPAKKGELLFLQKILKENDQQSLDSVEVSAKQVYNTFIQGEAKGDVEYFVGRIIETNTIEEITHNWQLIGNLAKIYGENSARIVLGLLTDYKNTIELQTPYSIIGTEIEENIEIGISLKAREHGLTIIGANGTGKSALISRLIYQDSRNNLGLALIDPHGDITKTVIASMPENRLKDVIYLNLEDVDFPVGLNLFECPRLTISDMAKTASFVYHVFQKIWQLDNATAPRLLQVLRALTLTLIENPGNTLSEAPLLLSSGTIRAKMVENLTNQEIILFWENYNRRSQRDKDELTASTINKISSFLDEPMIRNIVSQSKTTIDFRNIMDSGKILLVQVSPQFELASTLIGSILIGKLLLSALSRADTPEENRRQFNLYIDEVQRFQTPDLATLISEARKFKISTTSANQVLTQLSEENRASMLAAGNLIVFRVSGEDAETLAKNFDTTPTKEVIGEEPIRAPVADVISHLVKRGHNNARLSRFAQGYLRNFEDFIHKITNHEYYETYCEPWNISLTDRDVHKGREVLNETLYRCMTEGNSDFLIPPLALYILAVAQGGISQAIFSPYIKCNLLSPHYLQGFYKGAEVFGHPDFIKEDNVVNFMNSHQESKRKTVITWIKGDPYFIQRGDNAAATALVNMITELRFAMAVLSVQPVLLDTGQYQPKYQTRTFSDRENEIARDLTTQQNFQAKVKLLGGEHVIQTQKPPAGLTGSPLAERIDQIQAQTRKNYCKPRLEVECEIRERQERLKAVENKSNPTSTTSTQPQRTRRRRAEETPPAWS